MLKAPADPPARVVGIGRVKFTATILGASAELFFRLIDKASNQVIDLMTQPVRIDNAAGGTHRIALDLAGVAYHLPPGDTLDLQVSTSSSWFTMNRTPAVVSLAGVVEVPVLGR